MDAIISEVTITNRSLDYRVFNFLTVIENGEPVQTNRAYGVAKTRVLCKAVINISWK